MNKLKSTLLILMFLFISACAKKPDAPEIPPVTENDIPIRWIQLKTDSLEKTPFLIDGSIRAGKEGDTQRANFIMWGNEELPLRLDITAAGSVQAQILEERDQVSIYIPDEENVYLKSDTTSAFRSFGIMFPLSLDEIANFALGRFPIAQESVMYLDAHISNQEDNIITYVIPFSQKNKYTYYGSWSLDAYARPVLWEQGQWIIEFFYDENSRKPNKVSGKSTDSTLFTLFISTNNSVDTYESVELELKMPTNTQVKF